jgi:TRAP-type C4-dicarboxylate transport system substrate-binding protein
MSAAEMRANGFFDLYNRLFQKANIYFLMNGDSSRFEQFLRIYLNVKINKPEDLKGIKIATTPGEAPIIKAFGGVPVMMSPFEMYEALDRGLAKGAGCTADDTPFRFSFIEVNKYFISPGFGGPDYAWAFNLDVWKSIPKDLQNLFLESAIEVEKEWDPKWKEIHKGWPEKWIKKGGMQEIVFAGEDGKRFAQAYYDYHWANVIARSPVNGPKLKKLAGQ